jgi:hypothetical protein
MPGSLGLRFSRDYKVGQSFTDHYFCCNGSSSIVNEHQHFRTWLGPQGSWLTWGLVPSEVIQRLLPLCGNDLNLPQNLLKTSTMFVSWVYYMFCLFGPWKSHESWYSAQYRTFQKSGTSHNKPHKVDPAYFEVVSSEPVVFFTIFWQINNWDFIFFGFFFFF